MCTPDDAYRCFVNTEMDYLVMGISCSNARRNRTGRPNGARRLNRIEVMKLKLKEDPKEWRKSTMLSALGLGILSTLLCWRHILPVAGWRVILVLLAGVALAALLWPQWFRGYYRISSRLGFCISWFVRPDHLCSLVLFDRNATGAVVAPVEQRSVTAETFARRNDLLEPNEANKSAGPALLK